MMSSAPTQGTAEPNPIRVALLGAGIFATNSHAPVLKSNPTVFDCVGVWSRRLESAQDLADKLGCTAFAGEDGLSILLDQVDGVIMALPLDVQPKYVELALSRGKHVLSEKPVAGTVSEGVNLISRCKPYLATGLIWSVAENYRYEPAICKAAEVVKSGRIGIPFLVAFTIRGPFKPDNQYLNTPWRNKPKWYGGFFVDSLVHGAAMMRSVLGQDAVRVSSITSDEADYIPSVDTMSATIQWGPKLLGAMSVTYACQYAKYELHITGDKGDILLKRRTDGPGYTLSINGGEQEEVFDFSGIEKEFLGWAEAIRRGEPDKNSPTEALHDLAFVEACLESGKAEGAWTPVLCHNVNS